MRWPDSFVTAWSSSRLERRGRQSILKEAVAVDEVDVPGVVCPAVPQRYGIGDLFGGDDDRLSFNDGLCGIKVIVVAREGKAMHLTTAFDDQPAFDGVK